MADENYDPALLSRFMAGDTEGMDIHEHAGRVLRAEIARLRIRVSEGGWAAEALRNEVADKGRDGWER